jgi:3-phytase
MHSALSASGGTSGALLRTAAPCALLLVVLFAGCTAQSPVDGALPVVPASAETPPVASPGDAADDPAIWVHPQDPALSLILGTDKSRGLAVYDLSGTELQFLPGGEINNVDVRTITPPGGTVLHLAGGTDRTHARVVLYRIDPDSRRLSPLPADIPVDEPYGFCFYHSRRTNDLYAIATDEDGGVHQWRLVIDADGSVAARPVRLLRLDSVAEGCMADDAHARLFIAEEETGIWRYGAEPDAVAAPALIARTHPDGELTADVEGLAVYETAGGGGFLVASSQGADAYAVYDRNPPHALRGLFRIGGGPVDEVTDTDGLDVTSAALPGYPDGLLVVQDGTNTAPDGYQNFKYVSWRDIAARLHLAPRH